MEKAVFNQSLRFCQHSRHWKKKKEKKLEENKSLVKDLGCLVSLRGLQEFPLYGRHASSDYTVGERKQSVLLFPVLKVKEVLKIFLSRVYKNV